VADPLYEGRVSAHSASSPVRGVLLAYVAAIVGAGATARPFSIEISLACYAVLLVVLLTHVAFVSSSDAQTALSSLALVPVLKIGAIVLPQRIVPEAYWEALPAALALVTMLVLRAVSAPSRDLFRPRRFSPRLDWGLQVGIAATGPPMAVAAAYVLSALDRTTAKPALVATPASVLVVAAFSGLALEIVFRGDVQSTLVRLFGPAGIGIASLLYGGLFLGSSSSFVIILGLVTGLAWALLVFASGRVTGVAISHALFALSWTLLY
jgi:membrane protease YdiL (CAAX protease family)